MDDINLKKKILLVQLFSNGDCLYVTAVGRQIKNDYPNCHLTWAIAGFCQNILDNNPFVDNRIIVDDVPKNDVPALRKLKRRLKDEKSKGIWDEVFVIQNMDENLAYYDGCIRTGLFRAYPAPITVDITPVLRLSENEKANAEAFAQKNNFQNYSVRLLFEFAPQSGQLPITKEIAIGIAEKLVENPNVVVILSSALAINHSNKQIVDGSILTLRETAALSFYCTHLLGCSSGISWITTSDGAKFLPTVQLINPDTIWLNPLSRDFERFKRSTSNIIDLMGLDEAKVVACLQMCFENFAKARKMYNQAIPLKFNTSRNIVYNFLCRLQFGSIMKHIKVTREVYGDRLIFYKQVFAAIFFFPFILTGNVIRKRILKNSKG